MKIMLNESDEHYAPKETFLLGHPILLVNVGV